LREDRRGGRGQAPPLHPERKRRWLGLSLAAFAAGAAALRFARRRSGLDLRGRVALVTGGSRGLGLLLAEELGGRGARVAIAARSADELEQAAERLAAQGIDVLPLVGDVAREEDCRLFVEATAERFGRLDVLVNDAGVILVGPFESMRVDDFAEAMAVHFWGPLHLMRAALPYLRRRGEGRIVNIASIGGRVPVPHLAPYVASKFALVGLSGSLRAELASSGVRVTTVCPGLMRTGSYVHARFRGDRRHEIDWFGVASSAPGLTIGARAAARRIVAACRRGDPYLDFNWSAALASRLAGAAPATTERMLGVAAGLLPDGGGYEEAVPATPAFRQPTRLVPSLLTRLGDLAAVRNDELQGEAARWPAP
jgi:NAD(P)-dependent dehydrogenase (short-subunit alcohol dehydrogenase family)